MEAAKVAEFVAISGADPSYAHRLLCSQQWDQESSLKLYKLLQSSSKVQQLQSSIKSYKNGGGLPPPTTVLPSRPSPPEQTSVPHQRGRQPHPAAISSYHNLDSNQQYGVVSSGWQQQQQHRHSNVKSMMQSNFPADYRPPLAPKPMTNIPPTDRSPNMNQQPLQSGHHPYVLGVETNAGVFISHGKSDSVDSSDGLRRSSSGTRGNGSRTSPAYATARDSGFVEISRGDASAAAATRHSSNYIFTDDGIARDTRSHNERNKRNRPQAQHRPSDERDMAPTPPPRAYKLVHSQDSQGISTPMLIPHPSVGVSQSPADLPSGVFQVPRIPSSSSSSRRHPAAGGKEHHGSRASLHHRAASSTPGSRYGSSSSINHAADCSPIGLVDYRVNLSSVRATLGDTLDPEDYNDSHYASQSFHSQKRQDSFSNSSQSHRNSLLDESDQGPVAFRSDSRSGVHPNLLERSDTQLNTVKRTPSMCSIRCNSPLNRSNSSAASKNALLMEKVLGMKPTAVITSSPSGYRGDPMSASPVFPRDARGRESDEIGSRLASQGGTLNGRNTSDTKATSVQDESGGYARINKVVKRNSTASPDLQTDNGVSNSDANSIPKENPRLSPSKVSSMVNSFNAAAVSQSDQRRQSLRKHSRAQSESVSRQSSGDRKHDNASSRKYNKSFSTPENGPVRSPRPHQDSVPHVRLDPMNADQPYTPVNPALRIEVRAPLAPPSSAASVRTSQQIYDDDIDVVINRISLEDSDLMSFTNPVKKLNMEAGPPTSSPVSPGTGSQNQLNLYSLSARGTSEKLNVDEPRSPSDHTDEQRGPSHRKTTGVSPDQSSNEVNLIETSQAIKEDDLNISKDPVDSGSGGSCSGSRSAMRNGNSGTVGPKPTPEDHPTVLDAENSLNTSNTDCPQTVSSTGTEDFGSSARPLSLPLGLGDAAGKASSPNSSKKTSDSTNYHKLNRGISKTAENVLLVCKARNELTQGIWDALDRGNSGAGQKAELAERGGVTGPAPCFMETPQHTFMLPDLSVYETSFRSFVERDLIEVATLHSLESSGRLNWWAGPCQRLWPLATTGDGNCLLHAASLGMWGFHDRLLSLRSALHDFLTTSHFGSSLWRRWRWHTALANAATGLVFSDQEWECEWKNVLRLASTEPRNNIHSDNNSVISSAVAGGGGSNAPKTHRTMSECGPSSPPSLSSGFSNDVMHDEAGPREKGDGGNTAVAEEETTNGDDMGDEEHQLKKGTARSGGRHLSGSGAKRLSNSGAESQGSSRPGAVYESLEEIHIFALAHVLRRPIIVVADVTLKDVHGAPLSPIPFGGVYLPLEFPPEECQRCPLLLTYDAAHFSALVVMEEENKRDNRPAVIPLTTSHHSMLPVHFSVDPGEQFTWGDEHEPVVRESLHLTPDEKVTLLKEYLDVVKVPIPANFNNEHEWESSSADHHRSHGFGLDVPGDKKSPESSGESDEPPLVCTCDDGSIGGYGSHAKTCAVKQGKPQLNPLGSIGRSMSKKIKSFGTLKKIGRPGSFRRKANANSSEGNSKTHGRQGSSFRDKSSSRRSSMHHTYILAATLHTEKRMAFQEEMVKNYLSNARKRFQEEKEKKKNKNDAMSGRHSYNTNKKGQGNSRTNFSDTDVPSECINPGCSMFGTASTSYMCSSCYAKQKEEEEELELNRQKKPLQSPLAIKDSAAVVASTGSGRPESWNGASQLDGPSEGSDHEEGQSGGTLGRNRRLDGPQYGAGKSQFYAELDKESVTRASTIPTVRPPNSKQDATLFLSNSTFYNDSKTTSSSSVSSLNSSGDMNNKGGGSLLSSSYNINKGGLQNKGKGRPPANPSSNGSRNRDNSRRRDSENSNSSGNGNGNVTSTGLVEPSSKDYLRSSRHSFTPISANNVPVPKLESVVSDGVGEVNPNSNGNHKLDRSSKVFDREEREERQTRLQTNKTGVDAERREQDYATQKPCLKAGCTFFGNRIYGGYCSKCDAGRRKQK